jgi:acyl carrier protein
VTLSNTPSLRSVSPGVKRAINEVTGIRVSEIRPEMKLADDLGMDSMDTVELYMVIGNEFNVNVTDAEGSALLTVQDVIDHIKKAKK